MKSRARPFRDKPLPEPSWRTAKTPPSPASWLAMSVGVLKHNGAGKIPMSETMGIERLGSFPAGCRVRRGSGMDVKITLSFLAITLPTKESRDVGSRQRLRTVHKNRTNRCSWEGSVQSKSRRGGSTLSRMDQVTSRLWTKAGAMTIVTENAGIREVLHTSVDAG